MPQLKLTLKYHPDMIKLSIPNPDGSEILFLIIPESLNRLTASCFGVESLQSQLQPGVTYTFSLVRGRFTQTSISSLLPRRVWQGKERQSRQPKHLPRRYKI